MAVHRWVNFYRVPLPRSDVISEVKPGQQIARCITEIQEQITEIQEQIDVLAVGAVPPRPDAVNNYVLMCIAGVVQWVQTAEFTCPE